MILRFLLKPGESPKNLQRSSERTHITFQAKKNFIKLQVLFLFARIYFCDPALKTFQYINYNTHYYLNLNT